MTYIYYNVNMIANFDETKNKINQLLETGDYNLAVELLSNIKDTDKKVLDFKFKTFFNISLEYKKLKDFKSTINCLKEIEKFSPDNENILLNIALYYERINDLDNSLLYYTKILQINKRNYDALIHIAILYTKQCNYKIALSYIEKAKRLKPNDYKIAYAYFKVYEGQAKFKEALRYAKEMISLQPDDADNYYFCARTYYNVYDYKTAIEYCDKLLNFEPDNVDIQCLKIICLKKSGLNTNIIPLFEELIKKYPSSYTVKRLYLMQLLVNKDYENSMKYYPDVMHTNGIQADRGRVEDKFFEYEKKAWKRENLEGKTILIYQGPFGAGDFVMFSRYIENITKMAAKVIIEVSENFYELFKYNFKNAVIVKETKMGINSNEYDYSVSSMEIFYAVNMGFDNIPNSKGWLEIPNNKIIEAKNTDVFSNDKINIGIFWQGSGGSMQYRNIDFIKLTPLFELPNFNFISFDINKKDEKTIELMKKYNIKDSSIYIKNAFDTAAFLKNTDIFLTVDSFPLHLAGALGIKTLLYLPVLSEWRWFNDTNTTPWYNSVKIFKQTEEHNIDFIIQNIKNELEQYGNKLR